MADLAHTFREVCLKISDCPHTQCKHNIFDPCVKHLVHWLEIASAIYSPGEAVWSAQDLQDFDRDGGEFSMNLIRGPRIPVCEAFSNRDTFRKTSVYNIMFAVGHIHWHLPEQAWTYAMRRVPPVELSNMRPNTCIGPFLKYCSQVRADVVEYFEHYLNSQFEN